jgi:uncharacterized protein (TIGR02569 family)
VLKRADADEEQELGWLATSLPETPLPVARPLAASDGGHVVDGWMATTLLAGEHRDRAWLDIVAAGDAFHAAIAGVSRPTFLDERTHPWATGDRVAWDEASWRPHRPTPLLDRLTNLAGTIDLPSQLVHGDLCGNVLFAQGAPTAVIDLSLYWRPRDYGTAIVVVDALAWEGARPADLEPLFGRASFGQLLVRALQFRIAVAHLLADDSDPDPEPPFASAVALAAALAS